MGGSPNVLADLVLILFVPAGLVCFAVMRPVQAVPVVLLASALLLPEKVAFDPPVVPALGKTSLAVLVALAGAVLWTPKRLLRARPFLGPEWIVLVLAGATLGTALTNGDRPVYGPVALHRFGLYDAASASFELLLLYAVPFFLGRALTRDMRALPRLLTLVVVAAVLYSLPVLWELRMSPTLHRDVYGFFQSHFGGTKRFGGYRPMVFFRHGLALSLFILSAAVAASCLARARTRVLGWPASLPAVGLSVLLVACKSLGAIVYGLVFLPAIVFLSARLQMVLAGFVAVFVALYPSLRAVDLFPTQAVVEAFASAVPERGDSLAGRFYHEDRLLAKARERLLFGWGSYGRYRVYDARTGEDESVTDGFWVIQLGKWGMLGFVAPFALFLVPAARVQLSLSRVRARRNRDLLAGTAIFVVIYALDLLPNGFFQPLSLFAAGSLWASVPVALAAQSGARTAKERSEEPVRAAVGDSSSVRTQGASSRAIRISLSSTRSSS